ncbi:MAG: NAD(P)/FAD-dependent oxidoreductase [Cyclobacteriaceae bacterium]|nr:NAD(P)/FAD-dependent oxidoreductase [Cyclobacteriaceae bacterium]
MTKNFVKNLPDADFERIVIVGGGFAGVRMAQKLSKSPYQVVLIDKNNYHQFQPLFYQVATSGLEPSAISFPIRKIFKNKKNLFFRMMEMEYVDTDNKIIETNKGLIAYDHLVLALGADTSYFGLQNVMNNAIPMKSVAEALLIRNKLIASFEEAYNQDDPEIRKALLNIVVVGGGPTGVELAGAIAEMKRYSLPDDYPTMDWEMMNIYLIEASPRLLNGMSDVSGEKAKAFLEKLGVKVYLNRAVSEYDGRYVTMGEYESIEASSMIWAAGITGNPVPGLSDSLINRANRITVDPYHRVPGLENVYVLGDLASMHEEVYPKGHPQVAQVAIQQADNLARNFKNLKNKKALRPFRYRDLGSMATIGRKLAVVDLPWWSFQGFFAWIVWLFVHLMAILGVKNKLFVFLNWAWSYLSFDASLRLLIRPVKPRKEAYRDWLLEETKKE